MWPGPGRGVNGRVLGEMARRRPVSPRPAPPCAALHAGRRCALCACNACEGADLRAPNARVRVRLEREREAPHRSARLCDPRARTRSACDTNSRLVYPTASELAWPGNWGRRSVAIGEGRGARHGRTRSQSPPFSAPCTQRRGHRVWCVCVCQLQACRPTVMAGMQAGDALAAPPQCCGNEGLWGIAHGSPPAPLSRTCG